MIGDTGERLENGATYPSGGEKEIGLWLAEGLAYRQWEQQFTGAEVGPCWMSFKVSKASTVAR